IRRVTPQLGQAFTALLRERGLTVVELYVHGREHEDLYQLAELLIGWDEHISLWRMRHYLVVARVIGDQVVGTQGTPVELLGGLSLLLLSHTDTVVADPSEWQVDPWSGELRDGEVWGRGALDMKGEVAASAVTLASLKREGFEPAGDLIFVAAADEEIGEGPF